MQQDNSELNDRSCAGIEVCERAAKLIEKRVTENLPELTFSGAVHMVLAEDRDLARRYTGVEV